MPDSTPSPSPHAKTFCEFFAGIGLVREGLETSGWSCAYANDIDPKKRQAYEARFGTSGHFHLGDVGQTNEVTRRVVGRPFLATASFPCIDLSLAGHYRGLVDGFHSSTFCVPAVRWIDRHALTPLYESARVRLGTPTHRLAMR